MAAYVDDEMMQQVEERLAAMDRLFALLHGGDDTTHTNSDAVLAVYSDGPRDAVCSKQEPGPSTMTPGASPLSLTVPRGDSITDDCSSQHTLDFAAQQEEIAGAASGSDVYAKPATTLPITNSAVMMDDFGPSFDDFGQEPLSPLTEVGDSDNDDDNGEDRKPIVRSPVQHKPALPTPAPSDGSPYRRIPPRKTRSQTQTASTPSGFSAAAARTTRNRLSAAPSVSSPLAPRGRSSTRRSSMSALSRPGSSRFSSLSPSPSPARAQIKLDLDNPHPLATKLAAGLGAIAARFSGENDFEVPDECLYANPVSVAPQHPAAVRIKQPQVRTNRGAFGRRKKRKMDVEPEDQIAEATVLWPAVIHDTEENIKTIGCDRCDVWYHWCCVGFAADAILDEDTPFECPPCAAEIRQGKDIDPERQRLSKRRVQRCPRLDCPLTGRRLAEDEYFCERIIGRQPSKETPGAFQYYVRWAGYDIGDATWEEQDTLPRHSIEVFEAQAIREGIDVKDFDATLLLNEVPLSAARELAQRSTKEAVD